MSSPLLSSGESSRLFAGSAPFFWKKSGRTYLCQHFGPQSVESQSTVSPQWYSFEPSRRELSKWCEAHALHVSEHTSMRMCIHVRDSILREEIWGRTCPCQDF